MHSGGNQFDENENFVYTEPIDEVFKPYVSKYPERVFKKRGMAFKKHKQQKNKKEKDKIDNNRNNKVSNTNITSTNNKNNQVIKYKIDSDKFKRIEDPKKYCSYFGDSNNNVYYEIKSFNKNERKQIKKSIKEGITQVLDTRSSRLKMGNYNTFGVQSEALYIPNEK